MNNTPTPVAGKAMARLLELRTCGDPILRRKAKPVIAVTPDIRELAESMIVTMLENETRGVGLAAPQVGVSLRLITLATVDGPGSLPPDASPGDILLCPRMPVVLVNPEILWASAETCTSSEGCLSVPEIFAEVTRPASVLLRAATIDGEMLNVQCGGLLARCLLHEVDHLDGILFVDRLDPAKAKAVEAELRKLEKATVRRLKHRRREKVTVI